MWNADHRTRDYKARSVRVIVASPIGRRRPDGRRRRTWHVLSANAFVVALALALVSPSSLGAQEAAAGAGSISGAVIDVDTRAPLSGSLVTLQPEPAGIFPGTGEGHSGFASLQRAAMTDSTGTYRFIGLSAGWYRLDAVRSGYRAYSVVIELRGPAASGVALGLSVEPIPLKPLSLTAYRKDTFPQGRAARTGPETVAILARLLSPLPTDALELTRDDVDEGITAGEPDLFRAIQRLPGFATLSDYTAEIWTRGAPWSQTRVYFDDLPVFDPLHGLGSVTGVSPEVVGALWVYPGVHPVTMAEGAAGAVSLKTRRASGDGRFHGAADLSLLSTEVTVEKSMVDGRASGMLVARRSSLDWLTHAVTSAAGQPDRHIPYDFWDAAGRVDVRLSESETLEASALVAGDRWSSQGTDAEVEGSGRWENLVARVSLVSGFAEIEARHTLGMSRRTGRVQPTGLSSLLGGPDPFGPPDAAPRTSSDVSYVTLTGEWRQTSTHPSAWAGGYSLVRQDAAYDGETAAGLPRNLAERWVSDSLALRGRPLWVVGAWVERTWRPDARVTIQPALRVESAQNVQGNTPIRPAPRLIARYQLRPELVFSAGVGRTWQYAQSLALAGVRKASRSSDDVWLLAGPRTPALRADIVTAGSELWLSGAWRLTANAFLRRTEGLAVPDPTSGLVTMPRALFVIGEGSSQGLELAVRRTAPRWSVAAGYSLTHSTVDADSLRFAAAADRRHVLDATAMLRLAPAVRVGGAFTAASSAPFTRVEQVVIGRGRVSRLGPPNAERGPAYASLDLLLDWSGTLLGREVGAYVQLRNAFGRENETMYVDSQPGCVLGWCGPRAILENRYEPGLPRLPVVGLRARF